MKPLRIAQISDFHYTAPTWNPFRLFCKRILGIANWLLFRKKSFSEDPIDALPSLLKSIGVDKILLGGDFTSTALPKEFAKAKTFIQKLPSPWIAIPGNHDHYTYRSYRKKHYYKAIQNKRGPVEHKADFFHLAEHGLEAHRLASNWWLIALDTARATNFYSSRGLFSEKLEQRLIELLSLIPSDHSTLLFSHYPFFENDLHRHSLKRGDALEKLLRKEKRIKAFLHGHTHRNTIADLQPSGLPLILDSGCCAHAKRGSWNLLTLDDKGVKVDAYHWSGEWKIARTERIAWTR